MLLFRPEVFDGATIVTSIGTGTPEIAYLPPVIQNLDDTEQNILNLFHLKFGFSATATFVAFSGKVRIS